MGTTPLSVRMQIAVQRFFGAQTPHTIRYAGVRIQAAPAHEGHDITWDHMLDVIRGLDMLPRGDVAVIASRHIPIVIQPRNAWTDAQTGKHLMGGTYTVKRGTGPWLPKRIDLAALAGDAPGAAPRAYLHNVVRHEIGHVLSTLRGQDQSEEAAEAYRAATASPDADLPPARATMPFEAEPDVARP